MKGYHKMLTAVSALLIPVYVSGQELALPKQKELPPRTLSKLEEIAKEKEQIGKQAFKLFLKCTGTDGNSYFGWDESNVNGYYIDDKGKCKFNNPWGDGQ